MRVGGALIAVALLGACTATEPAPTTGPPAPSTTTSTAPTTTTTTLAPTTTVAEPTVWSGEPLPRPISDLELVDDVVVFEAVDEGDMLVAGVDAATGELVYALPAASYGRFLGQTSGVALIDGVALRYAPGDNGPAAFGHDAATGEELWSLELDGSPRPAYDCGGAFCVSTEATRHIIDPQAGTVERVPAPAALRVVYLDAGIEIIPVDAPGPYDPPLALTALDRYTEEVWRIDGEALSAAIGHDVMLATGWTGWSPTDGIGALFLGHVFAEGWEEGDPIGEEWIGVEGWGGIGFDVATGEITWGVGDIWPVFSVDGLVLDSAGVDLEISNYVFEGVRRLDPLTGESRWSVEFPTTRGRDIQITQAGGVVRLSVSEEVRWLDFETGETIEPDPSLLVQCIVLDDKVSVVGADGATAEFNRATVQMPCDAEGTTVRPTDLYGPEATPPPNVTATDDGHWVWINANGMLAGISAG
jgi:hypothetical protein